MGLIEDGKNTYQVGGVDKTPSSGMAYCNDYTNDSRHKCKLPRQPTDPDEFKKFLKEAVKNLADKQ